ncbi:MAG: hypothetical protein JG776_1788 [Caloramator sp.]|uniref:DUF5320 domain-containing protein n=1 Tax=Caloramator sp. TaxID=1871330 RepID=UPI001D5D28D0|nr:DUF5320 domain-containing protein [Caloramator sp.]MBZ4664073.1 hypothetical protein [Caloramator sp.]
MPRRDGTGPDGKGPRTGRGLGRCADNNSGAQCRRDRRGRGCGRFCRRNEN